MTLPFSSPIEGEEGTLFCFCSMLHSWSGHWTCPVPSSTVNTHNYFRWHSMIPSQNRFTRKTRFPLPLFPVIPPSIVGVGKSLKSSIASKHCYQRPFIPRGS